MLPVSRAHEPADFLQNILQITGFNVHVCQTSGNLYLSWPKLLNTLYFNFILTAQMHSFNHYTSVHVKIMHIDAKL